MVIIDAEEKIKSTMRNGMQSHVCAHEGQYTCRMIFVIDWNQDAFIITVFSGWLSRMFFQFPFPLRTY